MQNIHGPEIKFSCYAAETPFLAMDSAGWTPVDCHPDLWVLECFNGPGIRFRTETSAERVWLPDHWNLYPPGMSYAVRFREPAERYENLWLLFRAAPDLPRNRMVCFADSGKLLWQRVRELHFMRLAGKSVPTGLVRLKMQVLLAELEISFRLAGGEVPAGFVCWDSSSGQSDTLLQRVDWILQKHLRCPPSVTELAGMLNMSVSSFSHRLKEESGWTPVERIRYVRIEHAKKLLLQSAPRDAVRNTVWRLGFRSRQYFCTVFKQETGMTPGEFLHSAGR